jgi:Zn-dependent protease
VDFSNTLQTVLIYALPVLFAITVHEAAHGYAARHFGDNTAWMLGRITLNPLKHIDPVGTILMPALMYVSTVALPGGPFLLGYAKPVPVRFGSLRNPKRDMIWVAFAGPGANFLQAIVWGILFIVLHRIGVDEDFFLKMASAGVSVNLALGVFNLFPLPPLDGGRVAVGVLPWKYGQYLARLEPYGFFIMIALIVFKVMGPLWMDPMMKLASVGLNVLLFPVIWLLSYL